MYNTGSTNLLATNKPLSQSTQVLCNICNKENIHNRKIIDLQSCENIIDGLWGLIPLLSTIQVLKSF